MNSSFGFLPGLRLASVRRLSRYGVVAVLWLLGGWGLAAALIPADRLYTAGWQSAGVPGGIPGRTTIYTTINSTGDATDRTSAINNAINSCPAGQVVLLGPGTFRCNSAIVIGTSKNGVVLRGSGVGVTIIDSRDSSHAIMIGTGGGDWPWKTDGPALSASAPAGATVISMASTSSFAVGNHVRFSQDPDLTIPVIDISGVNNRVQLHQTTVTAKTASTITIEDPLPFALTTALTARANVIGGGYTENCGVEDLTVTCQNASSVDGIKMWNAYKCWLKNLRVILPQNHNIYMLCAIHCEVRKVFFDRITNPGSNGGGILIERSSMNLIVDNIIYDSFPNLEVNFGCTGNVFAYNLWDDATGPTGVWGMSVNMNHGAHNSFNLFEGNVTPSFQPDGYFGSVSHDTIFRNRVHGYQAYNKVGDSGGSVAIKLKRFTRYYNVVGNILGMPRSGAVYEQTASGASSPAMYQLGYPNIGNHGYSGTAEPSTGDNWSNWRSSTGPSGYQERDLDVANTLIRKGNYNTVNNAIPAGEALGGEALPSSLFLSAKPAWFHSLAWPPFNPASPVIDMTASVTAIPAGYRYLNNGNDPPNGSGDTTAPTTPTSAVATAVSASQINLTWTASTDAVGVTGYRVERSLGAGSTSYTQVGTPAGTSYNNTGLTAATVYNYRVRAVDAAGNLSGYSPVATATTGTAPDTTAPTAPANLAGVAVGAAQINLTWTASTDAVGVTGYRVERSLGAGSTSYTQVGTPAGTSYNNTGLTAATVYNYRVRAVDAAGNLSGYSPVATATTGTAPDTTAPTAPANLAGVAVGAAQINLTWTASTDAVGVTGYRVERSLGAGSTSYTQVGTPAGTSYNNTGLTAATVYNYRVRAVDAAGNLSGYSPVATATTGTAPDTTAPTAPANLAGVAVGAAQINLTWTASTDAVGVTGYRVERSLGAGSTSYTQVGTPAGTSYNNTGLTAATVYNYRVRAVDAAGNLSGYSPVATATTGASTVPQGLVAAYNFDEGTGNTLIDRSGHGNHGQLSGPIWTTGKYGDALAFNGAGASVLVPNSASISLTSTLTVEAWVYPTVFNDGWQSVLAKPLDASFTGVSYVLHGASRDTGLPSVAVSGSAQNTFGPQALPFNAWSHLAATYDGATVRLFVNATLVSSSSVSGPITPSTEALRIGLGWFGSIDDLRLYDRALSAAEILSHMTTPVAANRPQFPLGVRLETP